MRFSFERLQARCRTAVALLLVACSPAFAAAPVDAVPVDLFSLIREAADNPNQFAVNVPHAVSAAIDGTWTSDGDTATWSYAVSVPTAISLSFHAGELRLPSSAVLTVVSESTTTAYRASDAGSGDFWSRIQPGDTLEFTLQVKESQREQVGLAIQSLQAGYRSLSPKLQSHPLFSRSHMRAAGDADSQCVQNYACNATPGNTPIAQATVALLVGNLYQCTGTLINNTALDNTPYVLTARHCQGKIGGGNPGIASSVTVYWNAQTSCGATLDTLFYAPGVTRQVGATTIVEQEDAWLLLLDASPAVSNAQLAGFDASGRAIDGGYSIHHAASYNRQYVRWFGRAFVHSDAGSLGVTYLAHYLETVNQLGNSGAGASGAGLIDQDDRLVGVLSLGRRSSSTSSYGNCPAPTPVAPDGVNGESDFTSFAAVWDSSADVTSSTGARTLKSVLDPGNTGLVTLASMPAARLGFSASAYAATLDRSVTLSWNGTSATQCTATGGSAGDGWSGNLPGSGTRSVTQSSMADVVYRLRCDLPGGGTVAAQLIVHWTPPLAQPSISVPFAVWATRPAELSWRSNIGPCTLAGGALNLASLPATGSVSTTQASTGDVKYTLTCGAPGFQGTRDATVSYVAPSLAFEVSSNVRKQGEHLQLAWQSYADSCFSSGGAPGDGWAGSVRASSGNAGVNSPPAGTHAYTLVCSSGPLSAQKSLAVSVESGPAFVTLAADRASVTYAGTPADYFRVTYQSNLSFCTFQSTGLRRVPAAGAELVRLQGITYAQGELVIAPGGAGTIVLTATCYAIGSGAAPATASLMLTVLPPPAPTVSLVSTQTSTVAQNAFTLTWSSTDSAACMATGTWAGTSIGTSGSRLFTPTAAGTFNYGVACTGIDPTQARAIAEVTVVVEALQLRLEASSTSPTQGASFTLTWSANIAPCTASAYVNSVLTADASWSGPVPATGVAIQTPAQSGSHAYRLACGSGAALRTSEVLVSVATAALPANNSSSASSTATSSDAAGGGGALGPGELLGLLLVILFTAIDRNARAASDTARGS